MNAITLTHLQVASQHRLSLSLLPEGVHDKKVQMMVDVTTDHLVAALTAYVLSEDAGPVAHTSRTQRVAQFPRYLPKWLQRRWSRYETIGLRVTPKYIYPNASVAVPSLHDPIRISTSEAWTQP